jgi:hypothetical protein
MGAYLYGIVPELPIQDLGPIGLAGEEVYTIAEGGLRAVVSDLELASGVELRPERKHLAAHQAVLTKLHQASDVVLPVSFGTIADDEDGIRRLLHKYGDELMLEMERVKGKTQMNIRLAYTTDKPGVFDFLLERRGDLASLRDSLFGGGQEASRDAKIDFGQKIEAALNELRAEVGQKLESALRGACDEIKGLATRGETELARFACLVGKEQTAELERAVNDAARAFPDSFEMEFSGPFPPYDFTEMHLEAEEGSIAPPLG